MSDSEKTNPAGANPVPDDKRRETETSRFTISEDPVLPDMDDPTKRSVWKTPSAAAVCVCAFLFAVFGAAIGPAIWRCCDFGPAKNATTVQVSFLAFQKTDVLDPWPRVALAAVVALAVVLLVWIACRHSVRLAKLSVEAWKERISFRRFLIDGAFKTVQSKIPPANDGKHTWEITVVMDKRSNGKNENDADPKPSPRSPKNPSGGGNGGNAEESHLRIRPNEHVISQTFVEPPFAQNEGCLQNTVTPSADRP